MAQKLTFSLGRHLLAKDLAVPARLMLGGRFGALISEDALCSSRNLLTRSFPKNPPQPRRTPEEAAALLRRTINGHSFRETLDTIQNAHAINICTVDGHPDEELTNLYLLLGREEEHKVNFHRAIYLGRVSLAIAEFRDAMRCAAFGMCIRDCRSADNFKMLAPRLEDTYPGMPLLARYGTHHGTIPMLVNGAYEVDVILDFGIPHPGMGALMRMVRSADYVPSDQEVLAKAFSWLLLSEFDAKGMGEREEHVLAVERFAQMGPDGFVKFLEAAKGRQDIAKRLDAEFSHGSEENFPS